MRVLLLVMSASLVTGCLKATMVPLAKSVELNHICIVQKHDVMDNNFVSTLQDRLNQHNISSSFMSAQDVKEADDCEFTLEYSGRKSFDIWYKVQVLTQAELMLKQSNHLLASSTYRMGTEEDKAQREDSQRKLYRLVDQLLGRALSP